MSWCVVICKPIFTLDIVGILCLNQLKAWTPSMQVDVGKPGRYPTKTEAILPGFLFIDTEHLPYAEQILARKLTPHFEKLKIDKRLVILRDEEIQDLKIAPLLTTGQTVCFSAGPLKGQLGTIEIVNDLDLLLNVGGDLKYVPSFLLDVV